MKNFFKKLSFVMAAAMVITSLQVPAAKAATKDGILVKGKNVTKRTVFVGGVKVNFDYKIGKYNNKGANGKWSTDNEDVITVDKSGKVTAHSTGSANLILKVKKNTKKGIKKNMTYKVKVNVLARAKSLEIPASDKAISLKVGEKKEVMPILTDKVEGVKHSYKLSATSDNATDVAVSVVGDKVLVAANNATATSATVTVSAAIKEGDKISVSDSFTVDVRPNLDAKQAGAKTIKVIGADLSTDSAMYVLKNANEQIVNLKSVTVNTEKTEAVLEAYNLPVGSYTLVYNKDAKVMVDVVKAVVASIEIVPEDKLIKIKSESNGYVNYVVRDQFNNDITNTALPNLSVNIAGAEKAEADKAKKIIKVTNLGASATVNLSKYNLSVVDINTGVTKTALLTLAEESKVWSAEYKGVYDKKNKKFVESFKENAELTDHFILVLAKDQYGNTVEDKTLIEKIHVILSSATNLESEKHNDVIDVDGVKYFAYKIQKTASTVKVMAGNVEVLGINTNNGSKVTGKFEVVPTQKIANIEVYAPSVGLYNKHENVLTFTATDVDGNVVTDFDLLNSFNAAGMITKPDTDAGTIKFEKDKDKVVLKYTPNLTAAKTVLTFKTQTDKFKTFTFDVKAEKVPDKIKGIKADAVTGVTRGGTLAIDWKNLVFFDQYGNEMSYEEVKKYAKAQTTASAWIKKIGLVAELEDDSTGGFTITAGNTAASAEEVANISVTASANDIKGVKKDASKANKVVVKLLKNNKDSVADWTLTGDTKATLLDTYSFEIFNVRLDDLKDVKVDAKELYGYKDSTPAFTDNDEVAVKVVGTYNGKNISLQTTDFTVIGDVGTAANTIKRPTKAEITDKDGFLTKTAQVVLNNTAKTVLSATYKFKNEDRKVAKFELRKDGEISDTGFDTAKTFADLLAGNFKLTDQYGEELSALPGVKAYMFAEDDAANNFTVANSGKENASIKLAENGSVKKKIKIFIGTTLVLDQEITFKDLE